MRRLRFLRGDICEVVILLKTWSISNLRNGNSSGVQLKQLLLLCCQYQIYGEINMARVWELLDKAYLLLNAGYPHQARAIINQILVRDPQNIEAWDVYITTYNTVPDLESLREAVESIWKSKVKGRDYLNANRRYILRRINERISSL